jgi:hypothetical protein
VVTVTAVGTVSNITVPNVPQPSSQTEFCGGIENDATFKQVAASGVGTLTINSCSFSGNTGNIAATMAITSPIATTIPYTVKYVWQ